jgi:prepilin-type N-terminal cleavage/methylation domain-containing protein
MIARLTDERGMTIIEVMAAMAILLVGVLGTFILVEGGLSSTSRTTAREQATSLARDLVERTRQVDYTNLTYALAPATLRSSLPASDSAGPLTVTSPTSSSFTVTRRNVTYTVNVFACSIDDPTDGAGTGDATFCAAPTSTNQPNTPEPGLAVGLNVLGIVGISAGGSALETVCNALGISAVAAQLTSIVNKAVPVSVCPTASGGGTVQYDSHPDDLRRIRIDVSWTRPTAGSVRQTTLLTNPLQS